MSETLFIILVTKGSKWKFINFAPLDTWKMNFRSRQNRAIGYVENEFQEPAKPDVLTASLSRITLDPALSDGLSGLEPGMALLVIFVFPQSRWL
jgi:hypothetical protein